MAIVVLKEGVNRSQGQPVHVTAGVADVIIAGMPIFEEQDTTGNIGNYPQLLAAGLITGVASAVAGIALESNQAFAPNTSNPGAGLGGASGDYTNYNRGGLVAYMGEGARLQGYDDGRLPFTATPNASVGASSHPFDTSRTYNLNDVLYTNVTNGKLTNDATQATAKVGIVKAVSGAAQTLVIEFETRF
jgi:hypothetical protein